MGLGKLWTIAYRDLGRNRRRTFFTLVAAGLGLALLIAINGLIAGMLDSALQNTIRLRTGHVQMRSESYEDNKLSLQWEDLLANGEELAARAQELPQVAAAAPVLWAAGILNTPEESANLQVYGIETTSEFYAPIRNGMVAGEYLAADDRSGILLGKRAADSLGVQVGDNASLTLIDADGQPQEGIFTVRGLFSTGAVAYDTSSVFMPLDKAQAVTNTNGRVSAVTIVLHQQEDAEAVAAALVAPGVATLTWRQLNQSFLQTMDTAMSFYVILDLIVMLVVAVVISNTLLMSVFERVREMGILAALGMKGRQIMQMFLYEAAVLGLVGIVLGVLLGSAAVAYLSNNGIYIGDASASAVGNIAIGNTMYAMFVPATVAGLSLGTLVVILLASLYPAWIAARLEPVQALHTI